MRKLDSLLIFGLSAVALAPFFWEGFPSMAALYGIMTGISVLYGLSCLWGRTEVRLWRQRKVPAEVQRLWSRRMGVLYLANAALCPLGWLLTVFVSFDTDFILMAQIAGYFLVSLLGLLPLRASGSKPAA